MTDRLALIKARHAEAGGGDADKQWLIEKVERLYREWPPLVTVFGDGAKYGVYDAKTLLARAERERRHGEWAMRKVKRLRAVRVAAVGHIKRLQAEIDRLSGPPAFLDEALNSGRGVYKP